MKYLLSIYSNPANFAALPESERDGIMGEYLAFNKVIMDTGEYVDGAPLADHATAQTVRVR